MGKRLEVYIVTAALVMSQRPQAAERKRKHIEILRALSPDEVDALERGTWPSATRIDELAAGAQVPRKECEWLFTSFCFFFRREGLGLAQACS